MSCITNKDQSGENQYSVNWSVNWLSGERLKDSGTFARAAAMATRKRSCDCSFSYNLKALHRQSFRNQHISNSLTFSNYCVGEFTGKGIKSTVLNLEIVRCHFVRTQRNTFWWIWIFSLPHGKRHTWRRSTWESKAFYGNFSFFVLQRFRMS